MKRTTIIISAAILVSSTVFADTYVRGHTRSDGTYVQGHTRSSPDANRSNNRGSESMGGNRRDEYSTDSATNKNNSGYGYRDNDRDGVSNAYDRQPESKKGW